jgi:hypothetical protein
MFDDERLMNLVEVALQQPASVRELWLQSQYRAELAASPGLLEEILDRAAWDEKMGAFLHEPVVARLPSREDLFARGSLLAGRFRIAQEVGRGRCSIVLEAFDSQTQARVALKVDLSRAPTLRTSTPPVHSAIARLLEFNIVTTLEGQTEFAVMEFLEGPTLAERLREGYLALDEARVTALRLCQALLHARSHGQGPAGLGPGGVVLTPRGAVLTEDWVPLMPLPQADAVDLAGLLSMMRCMATDPDWVAITTRSYATLSDLECELSGRGGIGRGLIARLFPRLRGR